MSSDMIVIEPRTTEAPEATTIMRLFQAGYEDSSYHLMMAAWLELRDRWLRRYTSPKTKDAYQKAFNRWYEFIGKPLWQVTSDDVEAWIEDMQGAELSHATINLQLAACSSFYSYVVKSVRLGADGIERTLFFDGAGRTRSNPFRSGNVERLPKRTLRNTKPLSAEELKRMRDAINANCRTGARDMALFECYLRTGRRLAEIVTLRWGDIRPNTQRKGQYVFDWKGKGGKAGKRPFATAAYDAIVNYLKVDGRFGPDMAEDMFIFQPLSDHGTRNLAGKELPVNRPISTGQVENIVKKLARHAGLDSSKVHAHLLRHSFAYYLYEGTKDPRLVMEALDHANLNTTLIYLEGMQEPEDRTSAALQAALGF